MTDSLVALLEAMIDARIAAVLGSTTTEVSSVRLPADCKSVDAFNRACRRGDVQGAVKRGRVWTCTLESWRARRAAPTPKGIGAPTRKSKPAPAAPLVSDSVLAELGATARRTA